MCVVGTCVSVYIIVLLVRLRTYIMIQLLYVVLAVEVLIIFLMYMVANLSLFVIPLSDDDIRFVVDLLVIIVVG